MGANYFDFTDLPYAEASQILKDFQVEVQGDTALINAANQSVQSFAEYEIFEEAPNIGRTFINAGTQITQGYNPPAGSLVNSAADLSEEQYWAMKAASSQTKSAARGALETATGSGAYQLSTLLSLDVGVVGAAAAPLLGVALGVGLYELSPEFWTKVSMTLLPFCYPGTTKMPGWLEVDAQGKTHTIIQKEAIDALKDLFDAEHIGEAPHVETSLSTSPASPISCYGPNTGFHTTYETMGGLINDEYIIAASNMRILGPGGGMITVEIYSSTPQIRYMHKHDMHTSSHDYPGEWEIVNATYNQHDINWSKGATIDGKDSYAYHISLRTDGEYSPPRNYSSKSFPNANGIWALLYGTIIGGLPKGTEEWEGETGTISPYLKRIATIKDELGQQVVNLVDGVEIGIPDSIKDPVDESSATKPDNWPEGVDWPMEIDFPWEKPEGYEDEWPDKMPWPLPPEKPDWWPKGLSYSSTFPKPRPSKNAENSPDPNENEEDDDPFPAIQTSMPGHDPDPSDDPPPPPDNNPTIVDPSDPIPPVVIPTPPGTLPPPPSSGSTPIPVFPVVPLPFSSSNDGLISVYHPTDAQLKAFASWLWVTYADATIDKIWNNPFDGVIGLMEIYCTPTDVGTKTIRSGFLDSGISSAIISRYTEINCGSITIPEHYGNYFDYSPYSKAHVYLPFIGIVELNVDDVVGHAVNITYRIDEYNGSCIAIITCAKYDEVNGAGVQYNAVTYQFSGNCAVELPLSGGSQASIRAGMMQAAAYGLSSVIGGIVSGVSGNIGGAISSIGYGAANALGSAISSKSSVQHSGSFGASYGAMGLKIPYIIVSRPKQIDVLNYNEMYGYPSHCAVTIGSCTGYLRAREVHVKSSTATDEEKQRIESLLKEGVYVT